MKQEDVEILHDYLKENYTYENSHFINKDKQIIEGYLDVQSPRLQHRLKIRAGKKIFNIDYCKAAWIYHYKEYVRYIGFKDGNSANIDINNLYKSSMSELSKNRNISSTNKHGYKDVLLDGGKFYGTMYIKYKKFYSKACDTAKEAYNEYLKMKENYESYKTLSETSN